MALNDIKIRQAKPSNKPIKLTDSNGLYIEIRPNGSKLWRYRYRINGKENLFAIGEYPALTLQDARRARDEARELARQGVHPSHARQAAMNNQLAHNANTFEYIAREWMAIKSKKWTANYLGQATACIESNAFPKIGSLPIRNITAAHLLEILREMEKRGAEVYAIQLKQWISAIFRHAVLTLRADTDPASALRGVIHRAKINHSKAMSVDEIVELKTRLNKYGGDRKTAIAIYLLLYLFVRTVEIRKASWDEFSSDLSEWRIPEERMKMRRVHIVPLSKQAIALLTELREWTGRGKHLFPNMRRPDDVISSTTINRAFEYMGYKPGEFTGHDFRATASTHLHEMGFRPELIERQLAHAEQSKTRAAYNHALYLNERAEMMQKWADWINALNHDL